MNGGPRILIVGGGYGGMHTALRLERLLCRGEATVTIAGPRSYMTYQPLLAEAAAGNLEPRGLGPRPGVFRRPVGGALHGEAAAALELAQIGREFARHTAGKPGRFLAYSN